MSIMPTTESLTRETAFFDEEASRLVARELFIPSPADIERYRCAKPSAWNLAKDALFAMVGPVEGKRVLDYGCGHGENACILAACGAEVSAFDLSPLSIEQARERVKLHSVEDKINFTVCAAGSIQYESNTFDIVTGFGILHHLHTMLPAVFAEVHRVLKPGGIAVFSEPVCNSHALLKLRRLSGVPCYATPDERQLTDRDFEAMRKLFPEVRFLYSYGLARLQRVVGFKASKPLIWLDYWGQRFFPPIRRYFGNVIAFGRK
jgi:ubiquinone/menaquinone biosynthesis C-methylase UbiE